MAIQEEDTKDTQDGLNACIASTQSKVTGLLEEQVLHKSLGHKKTKCLQHGSFIGEKPPFVLLHTTGLLFVSEPEEIQAEEGMDVLLKYMKPQNTNISMWKWAKVHLDGQQYLWFYSDGRLYPYQSGQFRGRVRPADPQMRLGNLSIILSNTTVNDTGIYNVVIKLSTEPGNQTIQRHLVNVTIVPTGHMGGGAKCGVDIFFLKVILLPLGIVLVVIVIKTLLKKTKHFVSESSSAPPQFQCY
ncbi:uncharacterized protein [Nothobranchius furzeri]|uniref:uncharacterized protein n=1 Tax=Nothobranchius furzeri TaxID=105023 RepID=UPI003904CD79